MNSSSLTQLSLKIKGFKPNDPVNEGLDDINKIVSKFKNHPSIIKIKQKTEINENFSFSSSSLNEIDNKIKDLARNQLLLTIFLQIF